MKENKVLSVIYGVALLVALMSIVGLFYNAIEMLGYTTFYTSSHDVYLVSKEFTDFQKPIAITVLVASLIGIIGVASGVSYMFVKKPLLRKIFLTCIGISVITILVALIAVCSIGNSYMGKQFKHDEGVTIISYSISYSQTKIECFALYSTAMSSLIQNLVCFAVILALPVYEFVKPIIEKTRNKKYKESENSSVEELQDINVSEKE